jgi:TatD DNase family protein
MWIDSHCHLDAPEFAADRDAVWQAARAAGVRRALLPAVDLPGCATVEACCARYPGCLPAYGIHPLQVARTPEAALADLEARLGQGRPAALGEIGLDAYWPNSDLARQEHFFAAQLRLARCFDLPVILHVRRAVDRVLWHVRRAGVRGGIAHAFNGSRQQAEAFLALGFKLGFGGTLSYPGSRRIRRLATELPLAALVLETDAPDMPPSWCAGGRNSPAELPRIGAVLAELRGLPVAEVAAATSANATAVLPALAD